jgi:ribosome-associated toxin RatA of RatAB toxin-antitoxin module
MAERTESSIEVAAAPAAVLDVIADFASYPDWTGAVREVEILEKYDDGLARSVRFRLDAGAIRDTYTLAYLWDIAGNGLGMVSWTLVEAGVLKAMDGSYHLEPARDGGCRVTYSLTVDLHMPMLGMLRRKAEKVIIDTALNELKKRVER